MKANFTYGKIYNTSQFEILINAHKRASKERRFGVFDNENDAIACVEALNESYDYKWAPSSNVRVAEYWEKK